MKTLPLAVLILGLTSCSTTTDTSPTTGSSITTVTPSTTPPSYGSGQGNGAVEEFDFVNYGTLEEYTLYLDEILWEMDRINREISIAMLEEDWSESALPELMRQMEQTLLRIVDLAAPQNLTHIQGEFAQVAQDMAELYSTVAYLLGQELAFAQVNALQADIASKTATFNQVATVLLQAMT